MYLAIKRYWCESRTMRFPIRFFSISRLLLPVLFLLTLYIFGLVVVDSFYSTENRLEIVSSQHNEPKRVVSWLYFKSNKWIKSAIVCWLQVSPSIALHHGDSDELPPKYNLMEETYGKKWTKKLGDYLSSANCTVGNNRVYIFNYLIGLKLF